MRLRKDDTVIVIRGRDRGRTGRVLQVLTKDSKVMVEGINQVTKHMKPSGGVRQGGIITKEMPVRVANVKFVCPSCSKPARLGYQTLADGTKARFCKQCQETIE
jgi:large subunit ribosomal protein L24